VPGGWLTAADATHAITYVVQRLEDGYSLSVINAGEWVGLFKDGPGRPCKQLDAQEPTGLSIIP
jgi:hypothetical protein